MSLNRITAAFAVLMVCLSLQSQCDNLLPVSTTGQVIHHTYYCLSYDEDHEQAEWTYHVLTSGILNGSVGRTDNFRVDPKVATGSATLTDYKGSGYDRSHIVPAGDMTRAHTAMSVSFYMSYMSPQNHSFIGDVDPNTAGNINKIISCTPSLSIKYP
ncbi:DNA/RNA non-specific endonuclease [Bacteroidota bacterium]